MNPKLRDVYVAIADHQSETVASNTTALGLRLLKVSEEAGEVAAAYIGVIGANKRKGVTHTHRDVASELCDVIVTAFVALHDWTLDPGALFDQHVDKLIERIKEEGS